MTESELFEIANKHGLRKTDDDGQGLDFEFRIDHPLFGTSCPILFTYRTWDVGQSVIYLYDLLIRATRTEEYMTMLGRHLDRNKISAVELDRVINDMIRKFDSMYIDEAAREIRVSGSVLVTELDKLAAEV